MIDIGQYNKLKVLSQADHGFYLEGDETWSDILLPNKYAPEDLKVGDDINVFIYFDSEDLIIATTLKPYATVGEFAVLKVSAVEETGIFLDWGLEKDLFVPFREKLFEMLPGKSYVVFVYVDSSQRIAASTRVTKFLSKSAPHYEEGDSVDLLLYQKTDLGIKAVINGKHDGLIYRDDLIHNLELGQKVKGFIKKMREDNKIDLSLRPLEGESREDLAEQILQKLKEAGGSLDVSAKSSAETINSMFQVSRKKFKIALGHLYKQKKISIEDSGIKLID